LLLSVAAAATAAATVAVAVAVTATVTVTVAATATATASASATAVRRSRSIVLARIAGARTTYEPPGRLRGSVLALRGRFAREHAPTAATAGCSSGVATGRGGSLVSGWPVAGFAAVGYKVQRL
jgi:hypothetical protein